MIENKNGRGAYESHHQPPRIDGGGSALASVSAATGAFAADTPKKGGTLRLGMEGGSASDSLDPRTYAELGSDFLWLAALERPDRGRARATSDGELAESWEAKPGAKDLGVQYPQGHPFTSGKTLDADDVIYSLNLHRGETKSGAKDLLAGITDIKKLTPNQIEITLIERRRRPPLRLRRLSRADRAERLHRFLQARRHGSLHARELRARRSRHHQEKMRRLLEGGPRQFRRRRASLYSRRVGAHPGAALRADRRAPTGSTRKTVGLVMKAPTVNVVRTKGTGNRFAFVARCDDRPLHQQRYPAGAEIRHRPAEDHRHRLQGLCDDRQRHHGRALVTNISAKDIPQRPYDPDKAAFHFKKAGMPNAKFELQVSEGAFSGATDAAVLYQEALKKARHQSRREARVGRRLLGECLAQGAVLRRVLGRSSDRRQPACADLPVDRQLERHHVEAAGVRQAARRGTRRARRSQAREALRRRPNG